MDQDSTVQLNYLSKMIDISYQHVLDSFFKFTYFIGIEKTTPTWHLPLSEFDINFAHSISLTSKPLFVISPAASKDYTIEKAFKVNLCGSSAPRKITLGEKIQKLRQQSAINLIDKTTLYQLTVTLEEAKIVLAPDSRPALIATTQGTTINGLYDNSNPLRRGLYLT